MLPPKIGSEWKASAGVIRAIFGGNFWNSFALRAIPFWTWSNYIMDPDFEEMAICRANPSACLYVEALLLWWFLLEAS